jgi:hypothetical protein
MNPINNLLGLTEIQPWPDPVDGQLLLDDLAKLLRRFVVLPRSAAETLALWTLHTYAFDLRDISSYIGLESPEKRCGKTTLLTVLSELVHRPLVAANISPSAFFRVIEETRPTLLIDEADTLLKGNDELRGILNAGYSRKSAYVVRVGQPTGADAAAQSDLPPEPSPALRLARFSCWCPKIMAAIGRLPDTLADRCIVIRMQRRTHREQCERLRNLDAIDLRRQCLRFVLDHQDQIRHANPDIPERLNDRAADVWEPLLVLADLARAHWPALARDAAVHLAEVTLEQNPIGSLLFDLFCIFTIHRQDRLFTRTLVDKLAGYSDRPWVEALKGKPITERWLAQQLRPYGIHPRTLRIENLRGKGYWETDLHDTFRRYIPRSEIEALHTDCNAAAKETSSGNASTRPASDSEP